MNDNASAQEFQDAPADPDGASFEFVVRESLKARRVSLRVTHDARVEVVIPSGFRLDNPEAFIAGYAEWIQEKLVKIRRSQPVSLFLQPTLKILGEDLPVRVIVTPLKRAKVVRTAAGIILYAPDEKSSTRIRILKKWCLALAKEAIPDRVHAANKKHGFVFERVSVRDQKTRWGSCSRRGTLSFNWRLILLPPSVMEYLIYHELAHLRHMNHSKSYWKFVSSLFPDYRESERWLRRHSKAIVA